MAQSIKTIPLNKVKEFKKEVENKYDDFANSWDERAEGRNEMINEVLEMLDELIESEDKASGCGLSQAEIEHYNKLAEHYDKKAGLR